MKFNRSDSHSDSGGSFLDIVFCVCVVLCLALVAKSNLTTQKMAETQKKELDNETLKLDNRKKELDNKEKLLNEEIKKKELDNKEKLLNGKVHSNRFSGRGGQPKLKMRLHYGENGLTVLIGDLELTYQDFRKIICNMDRKESDGQPSLLFSLGISVGYKEASCNNVYLDLDKKIDIATIEKAKKEDPNLWIVNVYKMRYSDLEKRCRKFKHKYTSAHLGNWDSDSISNKKNTSYESRKNKSKPFIWFSVDNEEKNVIMGSKEDPVFISPTDFIIFMSNIEGYDGFYLEYRDRDSLKYGDEEIPDWVLKEIINPLGYGICSKK